MQPSKNKSKSEKMMAAQQALAWDIDRSIHWDRMDGSKPLLPLGEDLPNRLDLTPNESLALSQLLGLMAMQAIAEHEEAIHHVKDDCWGAAELAPDIVALGKEFFADEAKHARAFRRYIMQFADEHQICMTDLQKILPRYPVGWITNMFRFNGRRGGRAVWWLVMLTEEESIDLHRHLRNEEIDPLYQQIHQLHFEEERRHISYAPLMIRKKAEVARGLQRWFLRFDYLFAETMHVVWVLSQILHLRQIKKLRNQHAFFAELASVEEKWRRLPVGQRGSMLAHDIPFVSNLFRPLRHKSMQIELRRNRDFLSPLHKLFSKGESNIGH